MPSPPPEPAASGGESPEPEPVVTLPLPFSGVSLSTSAFSRSFSTLRAATMGVGALDTRPEAASASASAALRPGSGVMGEACRGAATGRIRGHDSAFIHTHT